MLGTRQVERRALLRRAGAVQRRGGSGSDGCGARCSGDASSSSTPTDFVGQLVHERRVGAVLQQPAHQVGQQVAVLADRRVDAAGDRRVLQHLAVDAFAHAVQALHLERARRCARAICRIAAMVPALWVANCG